MSAEEEIQAGLINAAERGVSLDKAAETFINAGYPEQAVRSALRAINEGNTSLPTPSPVSKDDKESYSSSSKTSSELSSLPSKNTSQEQKQPVVTLIQNMPPQTTNVSNKEKGVSTGKVVVLVIILILLLVILGASFFFRDALLSYIS